MTPAGARLGRRPAGRLEEVAPDLLVTALQADVDVLLEVEGEQRRLIGAELDDAFTDAVDDLLHIVERVDRAQRAQDGFGLGDIHGARGPGFPLLYRTLRAPI
jgi:hypothetical protein